MSLPDLVLFIANIVYSTSYVASRLVPEQVPPATLALIRLAVGAVVLAGVAYGSYSLFGRDVLRRHDPLRVTAQSILWGTLAMVPLAALELPVTIAWSAGLLLGVAYLSVVITALGYLTWNWALARVSAPRAAISLSLQPVLGALLGIAFLGETFTAFTALGGALIVIGLVFTVRRPVRERQ